MKINECSRPWLRFLWRDAEGKEIEFEFERVVFGINASPFLAQLVARSNAENLRNLYGRATETVLESTYMDDCLDSVKTEQEACELRIQLIEIWKEAGMMARKWISNSKKVAYELGLVGKTETTLVGTIGGTIQKMESSPVEMTIQSEDK